MGGHLSALITKITGKPKRSKHDFNIVPRSRWGARVPRWREDLIYPALSALVTYTESPTCKSKTECIKAAQRLQNKDMDEDGLPDVEYSFLVGGDGTVFEGRGWHTLSNRRKTIMCKDPEYPMQYEKHDNQKEKTSPDRRIVIAMIGEQEKDYTNVVMQNAVARLIKYGINNYYLDSDNPKPEDRDGLIAEAAKEIQEDDEQD